MRRPGKAAAGMAAAGLVLGLGGGLLAAPQVWIERSTTKVLKDSTGDAGKTTAVLEAARNELEAFQVVIRAGDDPVADVVVELSDLEGPGTIPAGRATLYLEHFAHIEKPSPCDTFFNDDCTKYPPYFRVPGDYPEMMVPFFDPYSGEENPAPVAVPFTVAAGDLQVVFVELHVPPDAAAGDYSGQVIVSSAGKEAASLPVALTVWDFDLPAARQVATSYGFHPSWAVAYHPAENEEHSQQIQRNYEMELHRHRIDFTSYNPGLGFEFDEEGKLKPIDFTAYDGYIGPRIDGSYFPDGAGVSRFNLAMFTPGHGTMGLTDDQFSQAAAAVAAHLAEKGWLSHVYLYSLDEPWLLQNWRSGSYDKIKQGVALLNAQTDLWDGHVLVTGPWQPVLDGFVDIWCPVTPMYGDTFWPPKSWPGPEKYQELLAQGQELWFYVCNANFPPQLGYDIDTSIGYEPRLLKWGAWYEHATGFLFWSIGYWFSGHPWEDFANYEQFGDAFSRNGDGVLVYPGNHAANGMGSPAGIALDGPVVSYRLKQIRDGLEDWELFILASKLGAESWARAQVSTAYRAFGQPFNDQFDPANPPWTLDEEVLFAARRNVALKVQHLLHPELYPDPAPPPEPPPEPSPDGFPAEAAGEGAGEAAAEGAEVVSADGSAFPDIAAREGTYEAVEQAGGPESAGEPAAGGRASGGCSAAVPSGPSAAAPSLLAVLLLGLLRFLSQTRPARKRP